MKIIEDFIPQVYQDEIDKTLLGDNFPWYMHKSTVSDAYAGNTNKNVVDSPQFVHIFNVNNEATSQYWPLLQPLGYFLMGQVDVDTRHVLRVKANLNMQDALFDTDKHFTPHIDCRDASKFITAIYYVNDADGDTLFFDKKQKVVERITPKKGTLVYFDGHDLHAGQAPSKSPYRCVINFNFLGAYK
jgi:hypothetical protein